MKKKWQSGKNETYRISGQPTINATSMMRPETPLTIGHSDLAKHFLDL